MLWALLQLTRHPPRRQLTRLLLRRRLPRPLQQLLCEFKLDHPPPLCPPLAPAMDRQARQALRMRGFMRQVVQAIQRIHSSGLYGLNHSLARSSAPHPLLHMGFRLLLFSPPSNCPYTAHLAGALRVYPRHHPGTGASGARVRLYLAQHTMGTAVCGSSCASRFLSSL